MAASGKGRETVSSYEGFDFRRLWVGRDAVTRLESDMIRSTLSGVPSVRLLEAGTGFGRLSPLFAGLVGEYVGVDLDRKELDSVRDRVTSGHHHPPRLLAHANLFHLPFVDAAFGCVASIRVYHHVRDPHGFLSELGRVLAPGGALLLSYTPKPTVATLEQDVRGFLRGRPTRITWDPRESLECGPDPFPIVVSTSARVRRDLRSAGFEVLREVGEGPERLAPRFPIQTRSGLPPKFPASFFFPTRLLLARRGPRSDLRLPPLEEILACPRCRTPLGRTTLDSDWDRNCPGCGRPLELRDGVLGGPYLPPHTDLRTAGSAGQDRRDRGRPGDSPSAGP